MPEVDRLIDGSYSGWLEVYLPYNAYMAWGLFFKDWNPKTKPNVNSVSQLRDFYEKVFLIHCHEPHWRQESNETVLENLDAFDLVLTANLNLLPLLGEKGYHSTAASSWTNGSIQGWNDECGPSRVGEVTEKEFSLSWLMTAHKLNQWYNIRHELWNNQKAITIPKRFYLSNQPHKGFKKFDWPLLPQPQGRFMLSDKVELYRSMFNIAFENYHCDFEANFSQRLVDSFLNKTIPIYRGYTGIGEFFNMEGIVFVNDAQDALEKINKLTPDYYYDRLEAIEDNYQRVRYNKWDITCGERNEKIIRTHYGLPFRAR